MTCSLATTTWTCQDDPGDLDLYLAMAARTGGPILELAVGSRPPGGAARRGGPMPSPAWTTTRRCWRGRDALGRAVPCRRPGKGRHGSPVLEARHGSKGAATGACGSWKATWSASTSRSASDSPSSPSTACSCSGDRSGSGPPSPTLRAISGPAASRSWTCGCPDAAELASCDGRLHARLDPGRPRGAGHESVTRMSSARYDAVSATVRP